MKPKSDDTELSENRNNPDFPGYPEYPSGEDIYRKFREEKDMSPENTSKTKTSNEDDSSEKWNEKDFREDKSGEDLDVPGSELDDEQEDIGAEDEENNFYSLGGDEHAN
jgi:hypothetical protein